MKFRHSRRAGGFTLIELMVVIAILAVLAGLSAPMIVGRMNAGDMEKCRAHVEQLSVLGLKYSQDMAHSRLLPTSGMEDDEDTPMDESAGWWVSIAQEMDTYVIPRKKGDMMKISEIFHCPSDKRPAAASTKKQKPTQGMIVAHPSTVSYVSWTDASEDPANPNSCIRTSAKQRLDELPWLSDGVPVKGESVTDAESFGKMVRPALERHDGTIIVAYAGGSVRAVELDPEADNEALFKRVAPALANKATPARKGKKAKKSRSARPAVEEDED